MRYTAPPDDLANVDFEGLYQKMQRRGTRPFVVRDWDADLVEGRLAIKQVALEWSKDSLLNLLDGKIVDRVLWPADIEQIKFLYGLIQRHLCLLTQTLKTLSSFISENFSIDDLLYL